MTKPPREPWYAGGLAFSCQGCGACCRGPGGYVWVTLEEARTLADALGTRFEKFAAALLRTTPQGLALVDAGGGDCPLLNPDGGCSAYAVRPLQCRTWPWWGENLVSRERWEAAASRCPGMNRGGIHSRVYIECEAAKEF